ncbi:DUF6448 family protein [Anaeromyxobacter oryzae]|uniref:Uncharacterized protein n=1 Tax=Anaeromyxobacter oryzae TaxID=2918170 RepID=A0ABM7WP44_9BACT|nr:DUF6448 family protein [Anaeromyxobacter oryzae]BDG01241.1 hypothetical protein AMOR_02370 [Anaeromyxobacter oryzae]
MTRKSILTLALAGALFAPGLARAHCDTLDGPVVGAARAALERGDLNPVLAWIQPAHEAEIRDAFAKARAARKAGKDARAVADTWFFETVVRLHRAGEGAPYTGLKPAGEALDPAVAAVDRAVAGGDPAAVEALLVDAVRGGVRERFARLAAERPPGADVAAGRRWVAAYVPLVHWAEAVHAAARGGGDAHGAAEAAGGAAPVGAVEGHGARDAAAEPRGH